MGKNVFGVQNNANQIDGADFIVRNNSPEILKKIDQVGEEAQTLMAQNQPSRRMAFLRTLFLTLGVFLLTASIMNASSAGALSFLGVFQTSPVLIAIALLSLALSVVLVIIERKRMKKTERSDAYDEWKKHSEQAEEEAYEALQVPQSALQMDFLTMTYSLKNGAPRNAVYTAFNVRAWVENDCLCMADVESVVAIPLADIKGISEISGKMLFYFWNKKEAPDSEAYRQYHIRRTYFGAYSIKGVRAAHIRSEFGEYELLIPPYELEAFLRLTGKSIRSDAEQ